MGAALGGNILPCAGFYVGSLNLTKIASEQRLTWQTGYWLQR